MRPPSSISQGPRRLRPWYLVAMMVMTWFIGIHGMTTGCAMIGYLREGNLPDVSEVAQQAKDNGEPLQYLAAVGEAARLRAMASAREVTFPLSAAKMLLAGLLLVASGLAMAGRPGARNLALQALLANALLAALEYALTRGIRGAWIEDVVRAGADYPKLSPEQQIITERAFWWWAERLRFALVDLGIFGLAAFALTRRRTKTYFAAVAAMIEPPDAP